MRHWPCCRQGPMRPDYADTSLDRLRGSDGSESRGTNPQHGRPRMTHDPWTSSFPVRRRGNALVDPDLNEAALDAIILFEVAADAARRGQADAADRREDLLDLIGPDLS